MGVFWVVWVGAVWNISRAVEFLMGRKKVFFAGPNQLEIRFLVDFATCDGPIRESFIQYRSLYVEIKWTDSLKPTVS